MESRRETKPTQAGILVDVIPSSIASRRETDLKEFRGEALSVHQELDYIQTTVDTQMMINRQCLGLLGWGALPPSHPVALHVAA